MPPEAIRRIGTYRVGPRLKRVEMRDRGALDMGG
jgi:hypothetical protein